jgi:hypothetical protein
MNTFLKTLMVVASIFYVENVDGAIERTPSEMCADAWGVVGEYCDDAQTLASLAKVSLRSGAGVRRQLAQLKSWKDHGGLLVALFGNPSERDAECYSRIKRANSDLNVMGAEEIKKILLSFVQIPNVELRRQLSEAIQGYIEGRADLSARAKHQLKMLLPNSENKIMDQLLFRDDVGSWLNGQAIQITPEDRQKIFIRILMQPRVVSEYSNEINNVLGYLFSTKDLNARYARRYIKSCLAVNDLSRSDLCLLLVNGLLWGCWDEADIAMNRMIDHPEMKLWAKIYCMMLTKPCVDNVIKPAIQYYTTLSWLGRKALEALKLGYK